MNNKEQEEIWKPITGYMDMYEVSNFGRIKRLEQYKQSFNQFGVYKRKMPEKILKTDKGIKKTKNKYKKQSQELHRQAIILSDVNGNRKSFEVARLVALEFIDNPNGYKYVRKKDGNYENCKSENLEWEERPQIGKKLFEEMGYKIDDISKKTMSEKHKNMGKPWMCKKIKCIELNKVYNSITEASKDFNRCFDSIYNACRKGTKSAGYHWEYVN